MKTIALATAFMIVPVASATAAPLGGPFRPATGMTDIRMVEGKTLSGNYLFEVVKRSKPHAEVLSKLLRGQRGMPAWVRNMVSRGNYVTAVSTQVVVDGVAMELFSACQPHNCSASELKALFSADGRTAYLRVRDDKLGELFLGNPTEAQKAPMMGNGL